MNVAIIDVGSNNIKLEIHGVESDGRSQLLYSDKVLARLGHQVFLSQALTDENQDRAIEGLQQFAKMIKSFNCKKTIAVGTAALREADSDPFVKRAKKESGIAIKVIPGGEEARLVYLGALAHTSFEGRSFCLIDIGGGSTEITIADESDIAFVESFRLGTVRLTEMFNSQDNDVNFEMVKLYVKKILKPQLDEMRAARVDMGLLTGGTARNLMEMVREREDVREEGGIPVLNTEHLKALVKDMRAMDVNQIKQIDGLDRARADIIFAGAVLLLTILTRLDISESLVSSHGLRDGVLVNHIHKKVNKQIYVKRQTESRREGLQQLSVKYNLHPKHAEQCAFLSMKLFDLLKDEHNVEEEHADVMYASALLHDIGIFIDYVEHHRHSQYLIENSDMRGFSGREKNWIGLIARYHRKGVPKESHLEFSSLEPYEKEIVSSMSAILRVADALDRSYSNSVEDLEIVERSNGGITLGLKGKKDLSLELWSAERKKDWFEKSFGLKLNFQQV